MTKNKRKKLLGYAMKGWKQTFRKNHPNWPDRMITPAIYNKKHPLLPVKVRVIIEEI